MHRVSLTTFVDFVVSSGTTRITQVRKAKREYVRGYHPQYDFYKMIRERIIKMHKNNLAINYLDDLLIDLNVRKLESYTRCIEGYRTFTGRKRISWFEPIKEKVEIGNLPISINPELGLNFKDNLYLVKLYFKKDELKKKNVDLILHLMGKVSGDMTPAILDVQASNFITTTINIDDLEAFLVAEARAFYSLWNDLEV